MSDFVHLHVHSHYSLLDGLPKIPELITAVKDQGMKAVALTDHGAMYGIIEFFQQAGAAGIKPIIGCEMYVAPNGRHLKRARIDDRPYHLILLAQNNRGYHNLLTLVTLAHIEGFYYKPRVDDELLSRYSKGLIALSSCLSGEVAKTIIAQGEKEARLAIQKYQKIFGLENFYLELQHNPNIPEQEMVNPVLIALSKTTGAPLVATNDVHYINKEDAEAQDVLTCIQMKKTVKDTDRMSMLQEDYSFKSADEMNSFFRHVPDAVSNSLIIADRCNVHIELGKIHFPSYTPPDHKTPDNYLRELAYVQIPKRYHFDPFKKDILTFERIVIDRVNYELAQISKMGFSTYFLIVQDFVNWAKKGKIMVGPGRGSAAGSIVSYLINITNIDPLRYDLIFERFLNPERIAMPDIDIDFADTRRDEVIRYVEDKYGKDHVAQIITFGTMAARAAVRDAGRVLGLPYAFCDKLAKLIPMLTSLKDALETVTDLRELYRTDSQAQSVLTMAQKLEGIARHASVHACGVLITSEPLTNFVPVQFVSQEKQEYVSQYSLHPIEDLGLLKLDFLGLRNLTVLEKAVEIIQKTTSDVILLDDLPLDNSAAFRLLQKGETTGIFQLESSGMKRYLRELVPTEIDDIIAMVSLYRPGPMDLIPDFIAGKHGRRTPTYLHPKLKPILEKTFGIAIYQEQVLRIAQDIAGFSLGEADVLRKAIGKKIKKLLLEQREKFITKAVKKGVSREIARKLFEFMEPFAQYGFNKSHAAAYALIAYQTAYLKANYPAQFMAALLTSDQDNIERIAIEVEECRRMGIEVLAPDVNESFSTFTVVKESLQSDRPRIRFGLQAIKNIGRHIVQTIINERKRSGQFIDLADFLSRVKSQDCNKKTLESLAKSGALDCFGKRSDIVNSIDALLQFARSIQHDRSIGQKNMFVFLSPEKNRPSVILRRVMNVNRQEELRWEKELLGLYISAHPLSDVNQKFINLFTPVKNLVPSSSGSFGRDPVKILVIINSIKRIVTHSGKPMLFVELEDTTGAIEGLVFPKIYEQTGALWEEDRIVVLEGKVNDKDGELKFLVESIELFDKNRNYFQKKQALFRHEIVTVTLNSAIDRSKLDMLRKIFGQYPGPHPLHLSMGRGKKIITKSFVQYSQEMSLAVEKILGKDSVRLQKNL